MTIRISPFRPQPARPAPSSAGTQIGTLEHVLEVPEVDVFDGIVIATSAGLRFIDADDAQRITRNRIWCSIDDTQAAQLPPPDGAPVYHVDALQDSGHSLHDALGRGPPPALDPRR